MDRTVINFDRRRFLGCTAGAFMGTHHSLAELANYLSHESEAGKPLIRRLELMTGAAPAEMRAFYCGTLGLRLVEEKADRVTVDAGETRITFVRGAKELGNPFYHFAFNIPENKILAAHRWQKKRTELLPIPASLRDPQFPDDVVDYRHWNAHSIFFFDPGGNVVEYIARHDLKNGAPGDFESRDILYASEIAFVVDDVAVMSEKLQKMAGKGQYRGASDQFAAVGDERGLLLVMKRGRVISFEAKEKKAVTVFPTSAVIHGARRTSHNFLNLPYELTVES